MDARASMRCIELPEEQYAYGKPYARCGDDNSTFLHLLSLIFCHGKFCQMEKSTIQVHDCAILFSAWLASFASADRNEDKICLVYSVCFLTPMLNLGLSGSLSTILVSMDARPPLLL